MMTDIDDFEPTLDLERLAKRLVSEDGIETRELALEAIEEYKKFFILCTLAQSERDVLVPSPMVDMVWQRHQLDTANYFDDCGYFCFPSGYLHRHCVVVKEDAPAGESKSGDVWSVPEAYRKTLQWYEETFEEPLDPVIWPRDAFKSADNTAVVGVAIPSYEYAGTKDEDAAAATEAELVAELMWVGELVRAELPQKQARCPGKDETINQIRFFPHCDCFVPSADQEQTQLEVVVREYVRFLMLVMKYHHAEPVEEVEEVEEEGVPEQEFDGEDEGKEVEVVEEGAVETLGIAANVEKVNEAEADAAAVEKKKQTKKAGFQVTPSKLVDELWHAHILRSPAYFKFCQQHAPSGRYIHHEPHFDKPPTFHEPGFADTVKAYVEQFGCPPRDVWGVLGESGGCGGCGGGGCGGDGGGGGCGGHGCGGHGGHGCGGSNCGGGGGGCSGGGGRGGPGWVFYRSRHVAVMKHVECGACSSTNGNAGQAYAELAAGAKTRYFNNEANSIHSNVSGRGPVDLFYTYNHVYNVGSNCVVSRSNMRVYGYLLAKYGRPTLFRRRTLVWFKYMYGSLTCHYLRTDFGFTLELYNHVLRQIYYHEQSLFQAACAIASLKKEDFQSAIPGRKVDLGAERKALYQSWWARNGRSTELLDSVNEMLAPLNVRLFKQVEGEKHKMYDHYMLAPTTNPWTAPAHSVTSLAVASFRAEWDGVRSTMMARKAELAKKWFKNPNQWQQEAFAAQNRWISATNGQLIGQSAVVFMPIPSDVLAVRRKDVQWDIEFAGVVDRTTLIYRQAVSDRAFLRQPFLDIHPKITVPTEFAVCVTSVDAAYPSAALVLESASAPSAPLASVQLSPVGVADFSPSPYSADPYSRNDSSKVAPLPTAQPIEAFALDAAPAPRTIQMSITVPPGVAAGTRLRFKTPQGRDMECAVPSGVLPGQQFVAQVEEGPPTTTPVVSLPRTIQVSITVPPGVAAGAKLRFRASPQGREMECTVPPGVLPGMQFMAQVTE